MIRIPLPMPPPINPSYQPEASITTVPAAHSIDYILSILERDGGMILKDLVSPDELAAIDEELEPWSNKPRRRLENKKVNSDAFASIPAQTILVPDLVGKSQTVAQICEHPVLEALPQRILREEFTLMRVGFAEPNTIDPLLSLGFSTIQSVWLLGCWR